MESDSDSDGSHISATPPRNTRPSSSRPPLVSRPPPPPPPPPQILVSSHKSRTRVKSSSGSKKPKKPPTQPPPTVSEDESSTKPSPLSTLPFQIRRPFIQNSSATISVSIETLPAGYFSKSTSFSKLQRSSLNFEAIENDPSPRIPARPDSTTPPQHGNKPNPVKRHLNLIGANPPLPPAKLRKGSGSEGNFVKLNLNRKYRKFKNRKGGKITNKNFYRRSQRKGKSVKESATDEDDLVSASTEHKSKQVKGSELIEAAVSAAQNEASDENLARLLSLMYGYDSFRDGQLEAIKMVLDGKSTMLVLPTGAGKSLCYQIPAMLLPGITLVVSPLVALMIDQLKQLPHSIHGGLLCSSQTPQEAAETLSLVQEGAIKVLFVSPERFLNAEFLSIFSAPSISLLVVDEAHCVSEWSHNFRPSYMRLRASILRAKLKVGCILAMTATATTTTLKTVMSALEIPPTNLIHKPQLRDNLQLSVSLSGNRMKDLLRLIKSPPFLEVKSIIIYCKFQYETDIISSYLCDNNISAKSYNSAILSKDRRRVQELFCSNKIRVVVATVAFGMGLDKRDVGAVIHYSLPESLEEYVQEIGRAGRDGRLSYCHLFYDDITYYKLRSLMHSDGVDEYAVSKFLHQVFDNNIHAKVCSIIKESASRTFDMKEEVMLTLLTQLELGEVQYLSLLPELNVTCILNFYKTSPSVLAAKDIVVSAILKKSETRQGQYVFDVPTVANSIGVTTVDLLNHLQNLKSKGEITYEVKDPAYCYSIMQVPVDFCSLSAHLTRWLSEVEHVKVGKLDTMFDAAVFAVNKCEKVEGCNDAHHTPCLHRKILDYFKEDNRCSGSNSNKMPQSSPFLRADIKVFVQSNSHAKFTPRAIARIMHGIPSPAYPSSTWSKTHFWGRYTQTDFQVVMEAAKAELMNTTGKDDRHVAK
ncbi:ATP-dependent DNA helicase Q-like 5 [Euphorbia lathyris]|uniref:ATP-dependent DNA helicase Q-like 5 n=1 Tax=Euphorbia lathyris TaxID=212925 RepID=UPI00331332BF